MKTTNRSSRRRVAPLLALVGAASLVLSACGSDSSSDDDGAVSFDKDITMVINFSAGGPTDTMGRVFAKYLKDYLPGKPNIIIKNTPAAGGVVATNNVYEAKPDGRTIGFFTGSSMLAHEITKSPAFKAESDKFVYLGAVPDDTVFFARADAGMKSYKDIASAKGLVAGGFSPSSGIDMFSRTVLDAFDVDYKYVTGYAGFSEGLNALDKDEVNTFSISQGGFLPQVKTVDEGGDYIALMQSGMHDDQGVPKSSPELEGLPIVNDVLEEVGAPQVYQDAISLLTSTSTISRVILAPPGMSDKLTAAYRKALIETVKNPDFKKDVEKLLGYELPYKNGEQTQQSVAHFNQLAKKSADSVDYLTDLSKRK